MNGINQVSTAHETRTQGQDEGQDEGPAKGHLQSSSSLLEKEKIYEIPYTFAYQGKIYQYTQWRLYSV